MVTFIPTPIGNPQDITLRALRAFEEAELFLCEDTRETKKLLRLFSERFSLAIPDAQFLSFHEHNGLQRLGELGTILEEKKIVFVSDAGMPAISDPGQLLVDYCQKHAIPYDIFPGPSAVVTAYAASGFEEGKFLFFGFLPHKGSERNSALSEVLGSAYNTVVYESPHRLLKLLEEISVSDPERELFLAKELSKKFQHYYRDSAKALLGILSEQQIRGEWVVVVRGKKREENVLHLEDILSLDIPPKPKAKLLSKVTGRSVKECYRTLTEKHN